MKKHCQYDFRICEALNFKFSEASTYVRSQEEQPLWNVHAVIMSELIYTQNTQQNMLHKNPVDTSYNLPSYNICGPFHSGSSIIMMIWLSEFIVLNYD